jgi:ATP-dependent helicase YprA (DUF1998 family)
LLKDLDPDDLQLLAAALRGREIVQQLETDVQGAVDGIATKAASEDVQAYRGVLSQKARADVDKQLDATLGRIGLTAVKVVAGKE